MTKVAFGAIRVVPACHVPHSTSASFCLGVPLSDPLISDSRTPVTTGFAGSAPPPRPCERAGYGACAAGFQPLCGAVGAVILGITGCRSRHMKGNLMSKVILV